MSGLEFAEPQYIHALWGVVLALAVLVWLEARGGRLLGDFVGPAMQSRIVDRTPEWRRRTRLGLIAVALVAIVIALMRPQWGVEFVRSRQIGAEIMIALDVSRSMLAEDVVPNRLERAKAEIRDLLPYLQGDQVGLIAFAGRATVLSPLTPDFGYLRLVLDNVDSGSVARGGTRLEEPIRKAMAGFGPAGDLARVILLITDGEDHDSFPVDAAREAAEQGIRILAIGFGDEAGSEIFITDPASGARRAISDADGRPVRSRLDGELLRELALVTEGAYVPAGTGVLDLESIFEAHIRPLMRAEGAETERTIRHDAFQWPLLVAWLALLGAVIAGRGRHTLLAGLALALCAITPSSPALAQAPTSGLTDEDRPVQGTSPSDPSGTAGAQATKSIEIPEVPREAFNVGVAALEANALDDAERALAAARQTARGDGETRYRASYDLGWLEAARAEALRADEPAKALQSLERAAEWFREAISIRPDEEAPRRNLEIVLARALALADTLAERDSKTLEQRLDALIEGQRALNRGARALVEILQASDDPSAGDALRGDFKRLTVEQRERLSEAGEIADLAGDELTQLNAISESDRTPEQAMRIAQLESLLDHQHRARERMGQTRSQLRRRQAERAHRRGMTALENLKRAREQLLDPVRLLDGLQVDASALAAETRALALAGAGAPIGASEPAPVLPDWLDVEYLAELQTSITERTRELDARFAAARSAASDELSAEQRAAIEAITTAAPHVHDAGERFSEAGQALAIDDGLVAVESQLAGLEALSLAREQLLDLRGLIELSYMDERRIQGFVDPETTTEAASGSASDPGADAEPIPLEEIAPALVALQQRNLERAARLARLLADSVPEIDAAAAGATAADPAAQEQLAAERARLEAADGLLALTESAMRGTAEALARVPTDPAATAQSRDRVATAVKGLESLRRLYFTIVEHLRDAARREIEIADETESAGGRPPEQRAAAFELVASRQSELAESTRRLADALHEQALAGPPVATGGEPVDPAVVEQGAEQAAERLTRAAELVLSASGEMTTAAAGLSPEGAEPDVDAIRAVQDDSVEHLAEAIAILEPPKQQEQPQQQDQQQQSEQQDGQEGESQDPKSGQESETGQPEGEPSQAESAAAEQARQAEAERAADPGQLLQSVRDREAERHRRRTRGQSGYEPVERDW